jgi:leader peptidase (prepilin peptidase)/N-methyltransferase
MIFLAALFGLLVGGLLGWLADFFPRFASERSESLPPPRFPPALALWQLAARQGDRDVWFWLRLGAELLSAAILALLWSQVGPTWKLTLLAGSYCFFLLIALIDLKYRLVLNVLTYPAMIALLLAHLFALRTDPRTVLLGGGLAFGIFFLTAYLKPGTLGMGDVKLATLLGVAFGFPGVLWALIVGAGLGGAVAIYLLIWRRVSGLTMPYAPFLCLGAMVALLYNPFQALV